MNYRAIPHHRFVQTTQPISGYATGWKRLVCWRVEHSIGRKVFISSTSYPTEESAKAAAKRLAAKH